MRVERRGHEWNCSAGMFALAEGPPASCGGPSCCLFTATSLKPADKGERTGWDLPVATVTVRSPSGAW